MAHENSQPDYFSNFIYVLKCRSLELNALVNVQYPQAISKLHPGQQQTAPGQQLPSHPHLVHDSRNLTHNYSVSESKATPAAAAAAACKVPESAGIEGGTGLVSFKRRGQAGRLDGAQG